MQYLKTYLQKITDRGNVKLAEAISKTAEDLCDGACFGIYRNRPAARPVPGGKLWYVTTAGGPYLPDFSYQYLHTLAAEYFGIPETELICAEMLDVEGFDADNLVAQQLGQIQKRKLL